MKISRYPIRICYAVLALALTLAAIQASAKEPEKRASYAVKEHSDFKLDKSTRLRYAPVSLPGGSTLTLITPEQWIPLAYDLTQSLEKLHTTLVALFGDIPAFEISLRLMEEEYFYRKTGAPRWTNAMYYRNQIIIPLSENKATELDSIQRSIRHEYSHAVIHALSRGKCPGWLDEGFAQWIEGSENPALLPALTRWLKRKKPISFSLLQGGFTGLEKDMVPVAYAQSLYSTRYIFERYGIEHMKEYLRRLSSEQKKETAFYKTFNMTEQSFERTFEKHIQQLAKKNRYRFE